MWTDEKKQTIVFFMNFGVLLYIVPKYFLNVVCVLYVLLLHTEMMISCMSQKEKILFCLHNPVQEFDLEVTLVQALQMLQLQVQYLRVVSDL